MWKFTAWVLSCNATLFCFCDCSKMRWQTVHTWAPRALTVSARPSLMRTRGPLYLLRCTRMWRRTAASRPRYTTLKMAATGWYINFMSVLAAMPLFPGKKKKNLCVCSRLRKLDCKLQCLESYIIPLFHLSWDAEIMFVMAPRYRNLPQKCVLNL